MKNFPPEQCLAGLDFTSYLHGTVAVAEKRRIEYHLSDCDMCFESFLGVFNQFLDHASDPKRARRARRKRFGCDRAMSPASSKTPKAKVEPWPKANTTTSTSG